MIFQLGNSVSTVISVRVVSVGLCQRLRVLDSEVRVPPPLRCLTLHCVKLAESAVIVTRRLFLIYGDMLLCSWSFSRVRYNSLSKRFLK